MKRIFAVIVCAAMIFSALPGASALADETTDNPSDIENTESSSDFAGQTNQSIPAEEIPVGHSSGVREYTADTLDFKIDINDRKYVIDSFIQIEVFDKNGISLGAQREWVGGNTESILLHYNVPEYTLGDCFTVKLVEGAKSLTYNDITVEPGEGFEIETSYYIDGDANPVAYNSYIFSADPNWEKEVVVYVNDNILQTLTRARIVNDSTLVPVRSVAEAMGIDVYYDAEYDSVVCSVGDKEIIYNLGTTYATFFGEDIELPAAPCYMYGNTYVPVRSLAEAFEASVESLDFGDHIDVIIGESPIVREYIMNEPVNKWDISSDTDYMVWVSKSEYTVRVYKGYTNNWELIYMAPCAIGAPETPTITGSFEYIERTFWDYGTYYVAPVLRFYNGYALHSTLLYYGGGEYDGRTGVMISHGCVRMHPEDINWIADTIPLYTRIYITE